ncbi:MAG: DUF1579 domain-containing protein [Pirellulaceae bacterium]
MFAQPQKEHQWLDQLVGQWNLEHNCEMPDGSKSTAKGTMSCRSLGGMWLICESSGDSPDGHWANIMTLGFDPAQNQFVGTFVGSMMANIWPYHGVLDPTLKRLPLYSEGPKFDGNGIGKYRDTIEIIDADSWLFTSELESEDATWRQFMVATHTRC